MDSVNRSRRRPAPSLRGRLTRALWLALGLVLLVTLGGSWLAMRHSLLDQFDETLEAKASALAAAAELDEDGFEIDLVIQDFAGFGSRDRDLFQMWRRDGRSLALSPSLPSGRELVRPAAGRLGQFWFDRLDDGRPVRCHARLVQPKDDDGRYRDSLLLVAIPAEPLQQQLRRLGAVLLCAGLLCLALLLPVTRLALRHGLAPLGDFNRRLAGLRPSPGRPAVVPDSASLPAELQPVAASLAELLERIAAASARERRFTRHAAHELRTPLAEIQALAELGARWPEEANPARSGEIRDSARALQHTLHQLALLAEAEDDPGGAETEESASAPAEQSLRPAEEIESQLAGLRERAAARNLRFELDLAEAPIRTRPELWRLIVRNLLDNAVSHAPPGSTVTVRVAPARLRVANPAPGLAAEDLERLFEPFWRAEGRSAAGDHSGLGLPLVRAAARRLGGDASAGIEGDQLVVEARFTPAAGSASPAAR